MDMPYTCIQPEYVKEFHCDGSLCQAKCCRGWQIEVDDYTYSKYQNLQDLQLRQNVLNKLKKYPATGKYRFQMDGINCPMLQADWLCCLQKNCGEEYLSDTCHQFPRRVHRILPDTVERVLSLACPVAARLALSNFTPLTFEAVEIPRERENSFFILPYKISDKVPYLISVQMAGISILQARQYSLDQRLQLLGIYLQEEEENDKKEPKPLNLLHLESNMKNVHADDKFWIRFLLELLDDLYGTAIVLADDEDIDYVPYIVKAFHLEGTGSKSLITLASLYSQGKEAVHKYICQPYDYMLENYLVQEFFGNLYPYKWEASISENHVVFVTVYRFMELILMSILLCGEEIDEDTIVALAGRMAQRTNHAGLYGQLILRKIHRDGGRKVVNKILETK